MACTETDPIIPMFERPNIALTQIWQPSGSESLSSHLLGATAEFELWPPARHRFPESLFRQDAWFHIWGIRVSLGTTRINIDVPSRIRGNQLKHSLPCSARSRSATKKLYIKHNNLARLLFSWPSHWQLKPATNHTTSYGYRTEAKLQNRPPQDVGNYNGHLKTSFCFFFFCYKPRFDNEFTANS
jgi:hypothetical protein